MDRRCPHLPRCDINRSPGATYAGESNAAIAVIGIDIGKNVFHLIGLDQRGAIVFKTKLSRSQLGSRLANIPPRLISMEACVGAHHLSRRLITLGGPADAGQICEGVPQLSPPASCRPQLRPWRRVYLEHAQARQSFKKSNRLPQGEAEADGRHLRPIRLPHPALRLASLHSTQRGIQW
jgi:hypothetical protein